MSLDIPAPLWALIGVIVAAFLNERSKRFDREFGEKSKQTDREIADRYKQLDRELSDRSRRLDLYILLKCRLRKS